MKVFNFSKATMVLILASIWVFTNIYSQGIESGRYYRLTTKFQGEGKSLDIINDGKNITPILAKSGIFTGQFWKITKTGADIYTLTTQWRGPEMKLDCIQGPNQNSPVLNKSDMAGTAWKIIPLGGGDYRFTNFWLSDRSLDIVNDGTNNKIQVAKTGNFTGQSWKLTPLEKDQSFGGNGGTEFASYDQINSISLKHGVNVDAIIINGKSNGGNGGTATKTLTLSVDEWIAKIEVSYGSLINYLKITTNKGNFIEGGKKNGQSATIQGIITALGGRGGNLLDQLKVRFIY